VYLEINMFVCIENNEVVSILSYEPNVPDTIEIVEITEAENQLIKDQTHYFDLVTRTVISLPDADLEKKEIEKQNIPILEFLSSTDWKVLRHLRQKTLGIATSLSEEEYLELENQRQNAANSIINP
jgi:hypothetical protein